MVAKGHKVTKPEHREEDEFEREIGRYMIKIFREEQEELWSYFPNIADKIERHVGPKRASRGKESHFYSYLTEREREYRLNTLRLIIEKSKGGWQVSKEEAIKALEDAASLRDYAEEFKESLLIIAQSTLGLSLKTREKQTISFIKGKSEHHSYTLIRGVTLSLTWDSKLIKIDIDPGELDRRRKALDFVGYGSDIKPDIAYRHDEYLGSLLHD